MKKLIVAALFGALFSFSAMAAEDGPKVLTGEEMDKVTAGFFTQVNAASVYQIAVAVANAISVFGNSDADARARNDSDIDQENEID